MAALQPAAPHRGAAQLSQTMRIGTAQAVEVFASLVGEFATLVEISDDALRALLQAGVDQGKPLASEVQAGHAAYYADKVRRMGHGGGAPAVSAATKVGRNEPCPCGSGKKFKKCHEAQPDELATVLAERGKN